MTKEQTENAEFKETESRGERKERRPALCTGNYDVGYRKPPVRSQFKKGEPGNPSGRPKGAANKLSTRMERLKVKFMEVAGEKVPISRGGKTVRMSKMDFILQSMVDKATKGDVRLMKSVVAIGMEIEQQKQKQMDELTREAIAYKNHYNDVLEYRRRNGIYGLPEPVPHPDDVVIDRLGNVRFTGPLTPEEKARDQEIMALRREWVAKIKAIEAEIKVCLSRLKDRRFNRQRLIEKAASLVGDHKTLTGNLERSDRKNRYK